MSVVKEKKSNNNGDRLSYFMGSSEVVEMTGCLRIYVERAIGIGMAVRGSPTNMLYLYDFSVKYIYIYYPPFLNFFRQRE